MSEMFIISTVVSIIFLLMKFAEMRIFDKESKPLKLLIRDALLVYFSVLSGCFILDQLKPVIVEGGSIVKNPAVFTGDPNF